MRRLLSSHARTLLVLVCSAVVALAALAGAQQPPPPRRMLTRPPSTLQPVVTQPMMRPRPDVTQPVSTLHPATVETRWQLDQRQMERLRTLQQQSTQPAQIIGAAQSVNAPLQKDALTLQPNHYVKTVVRPVSRQVEGRMRYELGVRLTGFDRSGRHVVELAPVLEVEQKAMRLAADGLLYTATLRVGLDDEATPDTSRTLSDDTALQISADRATASRPNVPITHTGTIYEIVDLKSHAPGDSFQVTVEFQHEKVSATIHVERPTILVRGLDKLPGLGIGTATVTLQLSEDAGPPLREVSTNLQPGSVDSAVVHISAQRSATVHVRTAGLRTAVFVAGNPSLVPLNRDVPIEFPTSFFLAALIGGVLGSLAARLTSPDKTRRAMVRNFVAGLIAGVIGAGLYLLGVNVSGASISSVNTELSVAVISALVSIAGIGALKLSAAVKSKKGA